MMATAKVTYPKAGTGISPNFFPASGLATIGLTLQGVLVGSEGTQAIANTVRQPTKQRQWMMVFQGITPKDGETFRLEIREEHPQGRLLAEVDRLTIQPILRGVGITYPADNANQCKDNVMAFGTLSGSDTALDSATLGTHPADFIYSDEQTGSWSAQFGVPAGTYTLSITGNNGGTDSCTGINCEDQYC